MTAAHAQPLEPRRLFVTFTQYNTDPVEIHGTAGHDVIEIRSARVGDSKYLDVTLNGRVTRYAAGGFGGVRVYAGNGNDRIVDRSGYLGDSLVGVMPLLIYGGAGNDRIDTYSPQAIVYGEAGNDSLVVKGERGATLCGGRGNDKLYGNAGDDALWGGSGADLLDGLGGDDLLTNGLAVPNFSSFGAAFGAPISITLDGLANDGAAGERDDVRRCERFVGSPFADRLDFGGATSGVTLSIDYNSGADTIFGSAFDDALGVGYGSGRNAGGASVRGGAGDDLIEVDHGDDTIWGEAGDDEIYDLDAGDDSIDGGSGDDRIDDAGGSDVLVAGSGKDAVYDRGAGTDQLRGSSGFDQLFYETTPAGGDIVTGFEERRRAER